MPLPEGVYGLVSDLQHLIPCSETKFLVGDTFHGVCGCFEAELVNAYTFQDELQEYGRKKGFCPYFLARHAVSNLL